MTIFNDAQFIKLVSETWSVATDGYSVHPKDVESLVAAMRLNLMKAGNARTSEEYVLRDLYREFNRGGAESTLNLEELKQILLKINLKAEEKYLEALMKKFKVDESGCIDFEEFARFVVQERYHKY